MAKIASGWFHDFLYIVVIVSSILGLTGFFFGMFAIKLSSRCNGYPFMDQLVQNTAESLLIHLNHSLVSMWRKTALETHGYNGWLDLIIRNLLKNTRKEQIKNNEIDYRQRMFQILSSKLYDCESQKLIFTTRYGVDSLQYENGKKFTDHISLREGFKDQCEELINDNKIFQHQHGKTPEEYGIISIDPPILPNDKIPSYSITFLIKRPFFKSAILGDFPSFTISKKRIYALPVKVIISSKSAPVSVYAYSFIIYSSYSLDSIC